MKPIIRISKLLLPGLVALLFSASGAAAIPTVDPATLVPTPEQKRATGIILDLIRKYHYKKTRVDDELSSAMLDRYLKSLDPSRSFFLADDIEEFEGYRERLDDALEYRQLEPAFVVFRRFRRRMEERTDFAVNLLKDGFDFSRDEEFVFDRADQPWATSVEDLNELWRKRVKNDVLALRLQDMEEEKIGKTLVKRYRRMSRRVRQLNRDDVYQFFINAFTVSIEPHTAYFSPRTSENFKIRMSLSLEGIGAALQTENEYTVVRRIIAGGPAELDGNLHVEDRIVGVGQGLHDEMVDVVSWRLEDVVDLIRGPKNSIVRLEVLGKDSGLSGPRHTVTLVRDKIKLEEQAAKKSVEEVEIGGAPTRIGVIDLPTFYLDSGARARGEPDYRSTTRDVRRLIAELVAERVAGIVIDLRGNSGGSLIEATELTGLFIESGPVVQLRDSSGRIQVNEDPDPKIAYAGPLAVLVDRQSASASEIFAGAIQDYRRGVVIGEPTFGKGTVQNLVDLDRRGGLGQLKVTIAQFFRVNGAGTQHRGVIPDIAYPTAVDIDEHGERALENALPWATVRPTRFVPHASLAEAVVQARQRHESRIKSDPGFAFLLQEVDSRRKARQQKRVSLLENRRRDEFLATRAAQRERANRYRVARGLAPLQENEKPAKEEPEPRDVLLGEAAHILADIITSSWQPSAMLH